MPKSTLSGKAAIVTIAETSRYMITLLLGVYLVRIFSKEIYGTYQQAFLVVWTLAGLLPFGLPSSIYFFSPQISLEKRQSLFKQTFIALFGLSFIAYLFLFFLAPSISSLFRNPDLVDLLKIFGLYIIPIVIFTAVGPMLICLDKTKHFAFFTLANTLLTTAVIYMLSKRGASLNAILMGIVIVGFIGVFYIIHHINQQIRFAHASFDWNLLKLQLNYATPIGFSGMVGYLSRQIDKFIIAANFIVTQFAVYNVGAIEIPLVAFLITSVDSVAMPEIVKLYKSEEKIKLIQLWHGMIRKVAIIIIPIFIYFILLAPKIITVLYTKKYIGATLIFQIYLLLLPIRLARFSVILQSIGHSSVVLIGAIGYLCINIALNIVLTKIIGFTGPAWSMLISTYLLAIFYILTTKAYLEWRFSDLYPWHKLLHIFNAAILSYFPIIFILKMDISDINILLVTLPTYFILFIFSLYVTNFFTDDDRKLILSFIKIGILR